jgi:hypothetical protein
LETEGGSEVDEPQPEPELEAVDADPPPPAKRVGVFDDPEEHFVVDDSPDDQATPGTTTGRTPDRDD